MSDGGGIVQRRESGAWVPRGGDGQYKGSPNAEIVDVHGAGSGEGVVKVALEPEDQPKIDVHGAQGTDTPAPSPATTDE